MYGDHNSQCGGNRGRRLDSHHDDEIEMTNNAKKIISQADRGLALTREYQKLKFTKIQ